MARRPMRSLAENLIVNPYKKVGFDSSTGVDARQYVHDRISETGPMDGYLNASYNGHGVCRLCGALLAVLMMCAKRIPHRESHMRRIVVFVLGLALGLIVGYLVAELTAPIEPRSEEEEPGVLHAPEV